MANSFQRQIRLFAYFFLGVLFSLNASFAFAGICVPVDKWMTDYLEGGNLIRVYGTTKQAACDQLPNGPWTAGDTCWKYNQPYDGSWVYRNLALLSSLCPDNTPAKNGQCTCDDKCKPMKDRDVDNGFVGPESTRLDLSFPSRPDDNYVGQEICSMNCRALVTKEVGATGVGYGGRYYGTFNAKFDGTSCQVDKPDTSKDTEPAKKYPKDSEEKKCVDKGMGFGYVNGNVMCVKPDSVKGKDTKTTTQNNPDGTKTQTETKTTLTCDGQVCIETTVTTTTTFNSDGTVKDVKTDEKKTQRDNPNTPNKPPGEGSTFCQENPSSPLCKEGSFTGSCGSEPSCSGDPVQCATARATWKTRCALETSQDVAIQGQNILNGQDTAAQEALAHKTVAMETVDTTGGGSSGSCPADKQVPIGDKTLTIPFSSICGAADLMKIALLAIATFTAGMIIVGGIK